MLIPEGCGCWLTASWTLCAWSQSSEPGGPTSYPLIVFHLPKPYHSRFNCKVGWQTVGGCVTGRAKVRVCDMMLFLSFAEPVISSQEAVRLVRYHLPMVNPSRLLLLTVCLWGTITVKTVLSSAFNKKMKTAKHLKCDVLRMDLTLPIHYCPFTVAAKVSVWYILCSTFDSLLYFKRILHFGIIDKKTLGMRPLYFKTNPHKREKRHEMPFVLEWWSLLAWNLARKISTVHNFTKIWQIYTSLYIVTLSSAELVLSGRRRKVMLAGQAEVIFWFLVVFVWGFLLVYCLVLICFFNWIGKKRRKIWKLGAEGKGGSWRSVSAWSWRKTQAVNRSACW